MIEKKQEYARKLKEYERQKTEDVRELKELADAEKAAAVQKFEKSEKNISRSNDDEAAAGSSKSNKNLPSFWIPSLTPQAAKSKVDKPDKTIYCPMSGKPLKMKDLIDVKFHEARPDETEAKKSIIAR